MNLKYSSSDICDIIPNNSGSEDLSYAYIINMDSRKGESY